MSIILFLIISQPIMKIEKITPGMKGYGLTVFEGTKIDTFNVEIIGVMKKALPKGNIILAKISGKVVDAAGVIAGMSGSPVYINDSLIGALAYNFSIFPKTPIGGITPIEEMINPPAMGGVPSLGENQIKLPFYCFGLSQEFVKEIKKIIPGIEPINSTIGVKDDSILPEPGSVLAIPFVLGDVIWAGIGTCTYRDGNKILGFGHTMALLGETELPMAGGYIYSVIPSSYFSYKMGCPTKIIGKIKFDNMRGIMGIIGEPPAMVELKIKINDSEFNYKVMKEEKFLHILLTSLVNYSLFTGFKFVDKAIAKMEMNIGEIKYENIYFGNTSNIAENIGKTFNFIQNNPYQKLDVKDIEIKLKIDAKPLITKIIDVEINKKRFNKNDTINLKIRLSVYQGGEIEKEISIPIPEWVSNGKLNLEISSGSIVSMEMKDRMKTIKDYIHWLNYSPKNNEIVITFLQEKELPITINEFFSKPEEKNKIFEKRIKMDYLIMGSKKIELEVL